VGSILLAAIILTLAILFANVVAFALRRLLRRRGATRGAQFAFSKMARYGIVLFGIIQAISALGFALSTLLAASAVLAVGIGFGLQNIAQNFISGVILLIEQPVCHGDFVKVGGTYGTVEDIGLRATHIVTRDAVTIIVPNSALITAEVINHSRPTTQLRIRINVGVAYETDPEVARRVLLDVAAASANVLAEPPPEVRLEDFGDSALSFALLCWIAEAREDLRVASELRFDVAKALARAGIRIPFPQRDVHVVLGSAGAPVDGAKATP
jgi:potassium-dependent mechanosensitive channel